jgi:ribonuclease HII
MLKLGIDDAGRGPVIGPMILAGVLVDDKIEREFRKLGVKDSKQLTEKRREFLADEIRKMAETFEVVIISPKEIDHNKEIGVKLNEVEAFACAKIINKINKGYKEIRVIVDCPSTSIVNWMDFLKTKINNLSNLEVICEHKADKNHISVSAASILAKSIREKEMVKLKKKFGEDMGSGYTSDPNTKKFLKRNVKKYNEDGIFRKSWSTWQVASQGMNQKKIGDF